MRIHLKGRSTFFAAQRLCSTRRRSEGASSTSAACSTATHSPLLAGLCVGHDRITGRSSKTLMDHRLLKSVFLSIAHLSAVLSLSAQGFVVFSNGPWETWITAADRLVYYSDYVTPIDDPTWSAALFELRGTEYAQLGAAAKFFGLVAPGVWERPASDRIISVPGWVSTTLQVRIFDGAGDLVGSSPDFSYMYRPWGPPCPPDCGTLMENFRAFCVPEPATLALSALGLALFLLHVYGRNPRGFVKPNMQLQARIFSRSWRLPGCR
jgi:hypothetical protein